MSDDAMDHFLSGDMLRTAIRSQLITGTSRRTISRLIRAYAPEGTQARRQSDGIYRVPVELIPVERRTAFLDALSELPNHLSEEPLLVA